MAKQAEIIPISPEVLRWARESLGLSINDVAKKIKKDAKIVNEWEKGVSLPTYAQLEKLAYDVYKRPLAVFFMSKPPDEIPIKQEFRNIPANIIEDLPKDFRLIVRQVKYYQLALKEIYATNQSSQLILRNFSLNENTDINEISRQIREFLNISNDEIKKISDFDQAFKFYRNKIEQSGIFIFQDTLDNIDGFCLYDNEFPIICVNSAHIPQKKIFTIFHELAHILLHSNDIFSYTSANENKIEILCNQFAAEILVPTKLLLQENIIIQNNNLKWTSENIFSLAKNYKVSKETILRKILDLKLTTKEYYKSMAKQWEEEYKQKIENENNKKLGKKIIINPHIIRKSRLGKNFINAIISAYHNNRIDMLETAKILKIKVDKINEYENIS